MCVFTFSTTFCLKHFSLWEELSEILPKIHAGPQVKYPLFLSDFNETCIFSTHFHNILKYQISRKSVQWEPSCFVGRPYVKKLKSVLSKYAPKRWTCLLALRWKVRQISEQKAGMRSDKISGRYCMSFDIDCVRRTMYLTPLTVGNNHQHHCHWDCRDIPAGIRSLESPERWTTWCFDSRIPVAH
jgi:hypothetical protein